MLAFLGFILQIVGIIIILVSNLRFWNKYRKYGLKKAFLNIIFPRAALSEKELIEASENKVKKWLNDFPLAKHLYENYCHSTLGAILTLVGVVVSSFTLLL